MAWPVIAGALVGGAASLIGGSQSNKANRKEAQRNRSFQERMRNTQWQAAVSDMQAAGINPAIAYSKGPAAAPSGSQAQQKDIITPAVSSALQTRRLQADIQNIQAQNTKLAQDTATSSASENFIKQQRDLMYAQTEKANLELAAYGFRQPGNLPQKAGTVSLGFPERDPTLIKQRLEAEIRRMNVEIRQKGLTADVIAPLARLMDEMGIYGPLVAGAGKVLGPGFARRIRIPSFKGRKLWKPWKP